MGGCEHVAELLTQVSDGDHQAFDDLLRIVYQHLRFLADRQLRNERRGHTLQVTDLAYETYLRLMGDEETSRQMRN